MDESDDSGSRPFRHVFAQHLRKLDNDLAEFRLLYDSFDADERIRFRQWLERVSALNAESTWNVCLRVKCETDVLDEDDNLLRWADAELSPTTMLRAIRAWDAGEEFAPDSPMS